MTIPPPGNQSPQYQAPQYQPPQYQQPYYLQQVPSSSNGLAIASMIVGVVGLLFAIWAWIPFVGFVFGVLGLLCGVPAVIIGHFGLNRSKVPGISGRGQAITGLITGYVTIAMSIGFPLLVSLFLFGIGSVAGGSPYYS
ncbi:DUF4190 domain-containing protein [Leucobacter sp. CSA1]|uniref:DUF4190 domain-containing protein n=1 Tax=Leucobacter chromiisoli TaxID=2796471 RepID=A0A934Q5J0_9MICO|nr:DUF4190 domain-containing protein [Leucobacter chromiisoli]MBK0417775.1 DUF4190 domain-containing protein [Leucobacter chromiisoli]